MTTIRETAVSATEQKFGTFAGVFTPTVLTILGAIMYLRLGWVVGHAGLLGAVAIIVLAHIITICTGLAVSSVATNTQVGAGGAFAIISRALGLEVGGSIGIPLYLAQGISVALYVLAFSEAWVGIEAFQDHNITAVALLTFAVVFGIAYISAQFASKIQYVILAIVGFSLFSVFLGSFEISAGLIPSGESAGFTQTPVWLGELDNPSFFEVFAIFFPAVTGIMVGISLSDSLRDPSKSIPQGTMGGIGLTFVVYLLLAYWLSRVADPNALLSPTVMVDKAFFGWAILAGMLGATFSSALGSLVAAPRVMQALAQNGVLPYSQIFAQADASGEPKPALIATGLIGFVATILAIAAGGLNAVAGVISMFFLITYAMLNLVVWMEQQLGTVSFRPLFSVPSMIPFVGLVGCVVVMFLINPTFSLVAIVVVGLVYGFLVRRNLTSEQSDVRSGLFITIAQWATRLAGGLPSAPERTWKPNILVPVGSSGSLMGSYRFLRAMATPQGTINALGIYAPDQQEQVTDLTHLVDGFCEEGIDARALFLEEANYVAGVRATTQILQHMPFRPNILFLRLHDNSDLARLQALLDKTAVYRMGIVLLARHPILELGREQLIYVWVSGRGPDWEIDLRMSNMDLALLTAYQLSQNWTNSRIVLCMAVADEETAVKAQDYLQRLSKLTRLPQNTEQKVWQLGFDEALQAGVKADLNIFGLPLQPDLQFCRRMVELTNSSCVFIRDSGAESALA